MLKFFLALLATGGVIILSVYTGVHQAWFGMPSSLWQIFVSLFLLTVIIFYFLFTRSKTLFFTQFYLLSIALKMLGYGALMIVIIVSDKAGAPGNAVFFLATYFLFTAVEIGFLFKKING